MGEDSRIPPYAPHARHDRMLAAREDALLLRKRMLNDADNQEQLAHRAMLAARRQRVVAIVITALSALAAVVLLYLSWAADDFTERGYLLASWALVGGTCALGVLYLATGAVRTAARRREAGERLLKRAQRQRERAGGSR